MKTKQIIFLLIAIPLFFGSMAYTIYGMREFTDCGKCVWKGTGIETHKYSSNTTREITVDFETVGAKQFAVSGSTFEQAKVGERICFSQGNASKPGYHWALAILGVICIAFIISFLVVFGGFGFYELVRWIFDAN